MNPVYISGLERQPSLKVLEEALKDWKEYCQVRDQTDDSESHGINEDPRRNTKRRRDAEEQDRNDQPTHSSINVIENFTNFQDFYRDRLGHTPSEDPQRRRQNSNNSPSQNKDSNVRFEARDAPSNSGDTPSRTPRSPQEDEDAQNQHSDSQSTNHHSRRNDDHRRRKSSRNRQRRRDSSDDEDDYSREPRTRYPPPNQFEALPCDNIKMFIKQYERFARDKRYPLNDYYMNAIKYLGVKVKTLMNRWTPEALEDWDKVKTYLIKTYEIMDSRQTSIKEFHRKTQLPNESYRDHMRTLTSLKMTGWPEEYAHCTSDNVKEPFNSSLMDQYLTTCKNRSVAIAVERLHAEKQAMGTPLTIENIIMYSEYLSESRFASGMTKIPTPDSCKICRSSKHTTKECVQNKKINQLQGYEYEDDEESDDDQPSDQELNAVDAPQQQQPGPSHSKPIYNPQKPDFLKKKPFQKFPFGKTQPPKDFKNTENACFKCGEKGHFAPDCKKKQQNALGFFLQMKFNTEKNLRELEKKMLSEKLDGKQLANTMQELTKGMEQVERVENYISQIISNKRIISSR